MRKLRCREFFFRHPYIGIVAAIVGMPAFLLLAVALCTAVLTVPAALVFGWV